jgi:hypothetical protein
MWKEVITPVSNFGRLAIIFENMRRFIPFLFLLFLCNLGRAQSVSFADMLNMTSMANAQVHDFLVSKGFKQDGTQTFNGLVYDQYKSNRAADKAEMLYIGPGSKTPNGNTQRAISYSSLLSSDLDNLLGEAKKSTLTLIFQGADNIRNIFRFDNSLFVATISVAFDKKSGAIDISQKENAGN